MKNQLAVHLVPIVIILCFVTGAVCTAGSGRSDSFFNIFKLRWWPHSDTAMENFRMLINLTQQIEDSHQYSGGNSSLHRAIQTNIDAAQSGLVHFECLHAETANKIKNSTVEIGDIEKRVNLQQVTLDGLNRQKTEMDNNVEELELTYGRLREFLRYAEKELTNATLERIKDATTQAVSQMDELEAKQPQLQIQFKSVNEQIETARQLLNETQSLLQQKRESLRKLQLDHSRGSDAVKEVQKLLIILSEYRQTVDVLPAESRVTLFVPRLIYSIISLYGWPEYWVTLKVAELSGPGPCSHLSSDIFSIARSSN